jgi:outer membrane protein assembly factor BamB
MGKDHTDLLFVGTEGHVRAIDKRTGKDVWDTDLPGTGFDIVSLVHEPGVLFAGSKGLLFALDPRTGAILWKNELKGLGHGHMVLASGGVTTDAALLRARKSADSRGDSEE